MTSFMESKKIFKKLKMEKVYIFSPPPEPPKPPPPPPSLSLSLSLSPSKYFLLSVIHFEPTKILFFRSARKKIDRKKIWKLFVS